MWEPLPRVPLRSTLGCGDTRDEAIENLKEAIALYFEDGEETEFVPLELSEN